jgi:hypothetical protein
MIESFETCGDLLAAVLTGDLDFQAIASPLLEDVGETLVRGVGDRVEAEVRA